MEIELDRQLTPIVLISINNAANSVRSSIQLQDVQKSSYFFDKSWKYVYQGVDRQYDPNSTMWMTMNLEFHFEALILRLNWLPHFLWTNNCLLLQLFQYKNCI
jgi:hypothetical protein